MKFSFILRFLILTVFMLGYSQSATARRPSKQAAEPYVQAYAQFYQPANSDVPQQMPTPMPSTSSSVQQKGIPLVLPPTLKKKNNLNQWVIVIDPGHGGDDYGTHSMGKIKYQEKYLNLTTAEMLKQYLQQYGFKVLMTRTDDTFVSLENRALFANNLNTKLFVSVHYNSAPNVEAEGIEVFYCRTDSDKLRVSESKLLAQCVLDKVIKNTKAKSRGVKAGNFAVIRHTKMPAILVEGGFLTNAGEMDRIKTAAYQKKIAQSIAQGIKDFLAKENVMGTK